MVDNIRREFMVDTTKLWFPCPPVPERPGWYALPERGWRAFDVLVLDEALSEETFHLSVFRVGHEDAPLWEAPVNGRDCGSALRGLAPEDVTDDMLRPLFEADSAVIGPCLLRIQVRDGVSLETVCVSARPW